MTEIERIADQLDRAFAGEAWLGSSLRETLADVTAEVARGKPIARAHSIWEIVLHIAAWEDAVRRRLEGEPVDLSPEEDWPPVPEASAEAWRETLARLESHHQGLRGALSRLTESRLSDGVPGKDYSVYFMLHGVIQHDLYHAGQIALLKKG
jgi:uncharacterized damage-inducible protein DinB